MKVVEFARDVAEPITRFESVAAAAITVGDGRGEAHVHVLHFEPGGRIGRHPTGFAQLLLVVTGRGWAEGEDGKRHELAAGQGAWFALGEHHAKGSDHGMTAVMIQVEELEPRS